MSFLYFFQKVAEVVRAAVDVLSGIEGVFYTHEFGGAGHQLHQAACVFAGDGFGIEVGFDRDNGVDEGGIEIVAAAASRINFERVFCR